MTSADVLSVGARQSEGGALREPQPAAHALGVGYQEPRPVEPEADWRAYQPLDSASALNRLGIALLDQGKPLEADMCFCQVMRLQPGNAEAHYQHARILAANGQFFAAVANLQTSLRTQPANAEAERLLGDILHWRLERRADALAAYRRVLAQVPDHAYAQLMADALGGTSRLTQVPADYIAANFDSAAEHFDDNASRRGDNNPALLRDALAPTPDCATFDVLDLGCGTGLCGQQFRARARLLIGIDLSANMLARAQARGIYNQLVHADLLAGLHGLSERFDLIVSSDAACYYGELAPLAHAVRAALKPGGQFAFTLDRNPGPEPYRLTPWVHFAHAPEYLREIAETSQFREARMDEAVFPGYPSEPGDQAVGLIVVWQRPN